ncbi:hypothetical protein Nepgr_029106 [Nepenthes gracilis]|uniref:Uncharacterized protein n=1 Tax=Nepenthes gracilis TaxID=150966 RepID=A0AAD3TDM1_NEPGR|nr:hypothetical protein Nepgr_029106 [Nepenthes gracilis]
MGCEGFYTPHPVGLLRRQNACCLAIAPLVASWTGSRRSHIAAVARWQGVVDHARFSLSGIGWPPARRQWMALAPLRHNHATIKLAFPPFCLVPATHLMRRSYRCLLPLWARAILPLGWADISSWASDLLLGVNRLVGSGLSYGPDMGPNTSPHARAGGRARGHVHWAHFHGLVPFLVPRHFCRLPTCVFPGAVAFFKAAATRPPRPARFARLGFRLD